MNYDNGWYRIIGGTCSTHYFFNDKPIHALKHGNFQTDYSRRYSCCFRPCKKCKEILQAYSKIGLANRLI